MKSKKCHSVLPEPKFELFSQVFSDVERSAHPFLFRYRGMVTGFRRQFIPNKGDTWVYQVRWHDLGGDPLFLLPLTEDNISEDALNSTHEDDARRDSPWVTTKQLAQHLNCSVWYLRDARKAGVFLQGKHWKTLNPNAYCPTYRWHLKRCLSWLDKGVESKFRTK